MKKNKKKKMVLTIIAVMTLVVLVIGATYAYFKAQSGNPAAADVKINANTVDTFTFSVGNPISFTLDQDNFASGKGNRVGNTFAKVNLTANNKTNTATEHYYVYLNIENNTFKYSIDENTPEIIMTVTDSTGTEITDIAGLTHTSVKDASGTSISGYDITNKKGVITLFNNREITATPSKEEQWNIAVTFVNYDASQNNNAGKSMSAKVVVQKEKIVQTVANICRNGVDIGSCIMAMYGIDDQLYYHDASLTNGAGDNSYRYAGANPNNYVCFNRKGIPCPEDNLYRIIGVFQIETWKAVKLVKVTPTGELAWDTNGSNTWSTASLKTYLNENFPKTYHGEPDNNSWKVGGNIGNLIKQTTPSIVYQNEIVNPDASNSTDNATEYKAYIGLMYASDYAYAASPNAWTTILNNYDGNDFNGVKITTENWLYLGSTEWLLSRDADSSENSFAVTAAGKIDSFSVVNSYSVRPVVYFFDGGYISGKGTKDDPIYLGFE